MRPWEHEWSTPEEDQADRELGGFAARTTIDDTIGKLMFIRDRLFMDVPDGLAGILDDVEEAVERAVNFAEELPEAPWEKQGARWPMTRQSGSECIDEACSCGMPNWRWVSSASPDKQGTA